MRARRLTLVSVMVACVMACWAGVGAVSALAAGPEAPETVSPAGSITANTALFEGVLNPHSSGRVFWYFAFSNPNGSSCLEGPTVGGGEAEGEAVHVSTEVTGLQPLRKYVFCLVDYNEAGETSTGNEVTFSTPDSPPVVDGESVSGITPFEAVMEGLVNPENHETTFKIEYATKEAAGGLVEPVGFAFGGVGPNVFGDQRVGLVNRQGEPAPLTGLSPSTKYFYRVIAQYATGETKGKIEEFQTLPAEKPTVEGAHFIAATPESDTLEGLLNPDYQGVSCEVQYVTEAVFKATGFSENVSSAGCEASSGFSGGSPVPFTATLSGLQEGTAYEYRIVASNGTGTTETPPALLARTAPAVLETLPGPEVSEITEHTAMIVPTVNPEIEAPIEATYYVVYGTETAQGQVSEHQSAGSGLSPQTLAPVLLSGLAPGTTYHYAVLASNGNAVTVGPEHQFTTPAEPVPDLAPTVTAQSAQYVNETSAVIEAEINPQGQTTSYEVQYGTSTGYGSVTPAAGLAAFTSSHGVFTGLNGLAPGTIYHYRIIATNASGTTYGPDRTFTTTGAAQSAVFTPFSVPTVPSVALVPYTFPSESGGATHRTTPRALTRKQRLARALKACKRDRSKTRRAKCKKQAQKRYEPAKKTETGRKRG